VTHALNLDVFRKRDDGDDGGDGDDDGDDGDDGDDDGGADDADAVLVVGDAGCIHSLDSLHDDYGGNVV